MNLREAAKQALEVLELAGMSHDVMLMSDPPQDAWKARSVSWKLAQAMTALRAALADTQDWDEVEALRASLREHMAEIHRLRAAGRQALEALENDPVLENAKNNATAWLRAALAEDVPETKFGNMAQEVDCYGDGNVYHTNGMPAVEGPLLKAHRTCQESRQAEPVAWITPGQDLHLVNYEGFQDWAPLYIAPPKREPLTDCGEAGHDEGRCGNASCITRPKREPLTDEQIQECVGKVDDARLSGPITEFARAIERAHGIGGKE